jgi:hypothetical protein
VLRIRDVYPGSGSATLLIKLTGMFILMRTTMDMKYMPMICEKKRRMMLELFELEIQMKNFDIVNSRPDSFSSFHLERRTNSRYEEN